MQGKRSLHRYAMKTIIYRLEINILKKKKEFLPEKESIRVIVTSGASCPDIIVDEVLQKILVLIGEEAKNLEKCLENLN